MNSRRYLPLFVAFALSSAAALADVFYVPDVMSHSVFRVNNKGATTTLIGSGLTSPQSVAVDSVGNLYVADSGLAQVLEYPASGGAPTIVDSNLTGVSCVAVDATDTPWVTLQSDRTVRKFSAGNGFQVVATLPAGTSPRSFAFEPSSGDLFVADQAANHIYRVTQAGVRTDFSTDVTAPFAVAFDTLGKPHVTDQQSGGRIANFTGNPSNGSAKAHDEVAGLGSPRGLAYDRGNSAHFLNSAGELRVVSGNTTTLLAGSLGDPQLLTARAPRQSVLAYKGETLTDPNANGAQFAAFGSPAIGGGLVAFKATLLSGVAGVASSNAPTLWTADAAGNLTLLARKTYAAPGLAGENVASFSDPVVNHNGKVAFIATLLASSTTNSTNNVGLFTDAIGGTLHPILRKGDPAPGVAGAKFTGFRQLVLPDDFGPMVMATISGTGVNSSNNVGLWSADTAGTFNLVLRKGDKFLAGGKTRQLASFNLFKPTVLSLGQSRHFAPGRQVTCGATFTDGFTAIMLGQATGGEVTLLEKDNQVGPALSGAKFTGFGSPAVNDMATKFAFLGKLAPNFGGVTTASAVALFKYDSGTNTLVAQRNYAPNPPLPNANGAIFSSLSDPVARPDGGLAFRANLKPGLGGVLTSNSAGLWSDLGAGLQLDVRQGDRAPDVTGNVTLTAFRQFVLPATGGVVFTATMAGSGITTTNNLGLWANDGAGGNDLLVRTGPGLTVNAKSRTVTRITVFKTLPIVAGQSRHFDANGTVACGIACSDGMQAILTFDRP